METRELKPYFVLIVLLAAASLTYAFTVSYEVTPAAGVEVRLPESIGNWQGSELRYCMNPDHQREYVMEDLDDRNTCPDCGFELGGMSYMEQQILPDDTIILKKRYQHPIEDMVMASIVLSGAERSSIHRPEVCLQGQDQKITRNRVISVPIEGRNDLGVMVLDIQRSFLREDGRTHDSLGYYAYWFVGKDRETPHHLQRMFWMATDSIFNNVAHRWAYISVAGSRDGPNDEAYLDQIREFVAEFYPKMALN